MRAQLAALFEACTRRGRSGAKHYRVFWACKLLEMLTTLAQNSLDAKAEAIGSALPARTVGKIHDLCAYLDAHYAEKITGSTIEAEAGMNFDYLNRTFRRITGKTVFQYLNCVRINRVKELLKTTDMKLAEIAALTGFSDEFYLSRQFKSHGRLPGALRARTDEKLRPDERPAAVCRRCVPYVRAALYLNGGAAELRMGALPAISNEESRRNQKSVSPGSVMCAERCGYGSSSMYASS